MPYLHRVLIYEKYCMDALSTCLKKSYIFAGPNIYLTMNKVNGLLYGLLSSASFGLIPLFTIPAMQAGMQFESILFYRFLFACLALGGILLVNGQSFRIKRQDIPSLFLLALLYLMSAAVFLFWGYKFMASGVATTIHFMYPVLTTLIMMLFFKEKEVRLADRCHCIRSGRSLFLIRRRYKNGGLFFPGTFHCSSVGTRICALSRHNEPIKDWTDERATAYFLCIPIRRYSPFYRNGNHQPASTHQRMAYCRQLDSISFNPYRSF